MASRARRWPVLRADLAAVKDRDPACQGTLDALVAYPGLHALWAHRIAHGLWRRGHRLSARLVATVSRVATGVDIHPGARLGPGVLIDHGVGVVIGETAECGRDVTVYQGVTLGGTTLRTGKRHPTVGDRVVLGAGAKVLGAVTLGDDVRVGANAVVVDDIPAGAVVVGIPGKAVSRVAGVGNDMQRDSGVDVVDARLASIDERLAALERTVTGTASTHGPRQVDGVWEGDDFVI